MADNKMLLWLALGGAALWFMSQNQTAVAGGGTNTGTAGNTGTDGNGNPIGTAGNGGTGGGGTQGGN